MIHMYGLASHQQTQIWTFTLPREINYSPYYSRQQRNQFSFTEWKVGHLQNSVRLDETLDGCYTWLLRIVLNITWQKTCDVVRGNFPKVSIKDLDWRLKTSGLHHCHKEDCLRSTILGLGNGVAESWNKAFIQLFKEDKVLDSVPEIQTAMEDQRGLGKILYKADKNGRKRLIQNWMGQLK